MGFFRHDKDKKAAVLSGGERIKLSLSMLFVTHDMDFIDIVADEMWEIADGKMSVV